MPALPLSKTQIDKLGDRLRDLPEPDPADLELLERVLDVYGAALKIVVARLLQLGLVPTARQKVTATIVKKLRRDRGFKLRAIQDLVGARVVLDGDLDLQDATVDRFRATREEDLPELHQLVRSNYLAYLKAFREAGNRLHRKLTELADRVDVMGSPA